MHPMDFEEFLWALGHEDLMDYIKDCFTSHTPLGGLLHRKAMDLFQQYMIVGGMPQAVELYVEKKDFDIVDRAKRNILSIYRADISKYATGYEQKVTRVFDTIPSQLQRHEKRFRISDLEKGARTRSYANAFFWLEELRVINVCFAATEPNVGLNLNRDDAKRKIYMVDTSLLIAMAFDEKDIQQGLLYKKNNVRQTGDKQRHACRKYCSPDVAGGRQQTILLLQRLAQQRRQNGDRLPCQETIGDITPQHFPHRSKVVRTLYTHFPGQIQTEILGIHCNTIRDTF